MVGIFFFINQLLVKANNSNVYEDSAIRQKYLEFCLAMLWEVFSDPIGEVFPQDI